MRETKIGLGPDDRTMRDARSVAATGETLAADSSESAQARASAPGVGRGMHVEGGPQRGDAIGRFVVLGVLGVGGMGVVYSAYDPHLDRKVAIKLLTAEAATASADAHTRLLREAQAMAKIHHPNVIVVHEVGTLGEQVYVAMEFADGGTLRDWLSAKPRELREVLDVFTQAGRGLAAAHAAGLVHRDFKPDNVLLSQDGTARVTDFGLVGVMSDTEHDTVREPKISEPELRDELSKSVRSTPLTEDLTRTGAIMGTPRYMAPEQFRGAAATDRTDQFAFCVALYEALYGERPFAGGSYAELCTNVLTGELLPPPKGTKVPGWLRKVLLRGLSIDPAQRHGSMKDVLAALAHDSRRLRTGLVITGIAAACAGGAAIAIAAHPGGKSECQAGGEHVRAVWNPSKKAQLQQAFAKSQRMIAGPVFERSAQLIDAWTKQWEDGYVGACEATRVHGEQSEHLLDLRMLCLDQHLEAARATIDAAMTADSDTIDHAVGAFAALPPVAACADTKALLADVPPPEAKAQADEVAAVRKELEHAHAEEKLGHYKAARQLAEPLLPAARATKYDAVVAEAQLQLGRLQQQLGDGAAADTLRDAMHTAEQAGDNTTMLDASAWLIFTLTTHESQFDRAQEVAGFAEAAAAHEQPPMDVYVRLQDTIALLDASQNRIDQAQARYEKTLALAGEKLGPDHAGTLTTLNQYATVLRDRGKLEDARKAYERVVESREKTLGPDHPDVAAALGNVGIVYRMEGKFDQAKAAYDRALKIDKASYGDSHPEVGTILNDIGSLYADEQDPQKALDYYRQALAMWETTYGKDNVALLPALANVGGQLSELHQYDDARDTLERALAISEAAQGHDNPHEAGILNNLALVDEAQGNLDAAMATFERARKISEKVGGPESPDVVDEYLNEAGVLKRQKKLPEAVALEERMLPIAEKAYGAGHPHVAMLLVNLGLHEEELDKHQDALATFDKAQPMLEAKFGKDHVYVSYVLLGKGQALVGLERYDEGLALFNRALEIRQKAGVPPEMLKEATDAIADGQKRKRSHR
ncbi:MAG TPA: serine/threonine-protein kinase [Kofleriaceae bacterium]|nr:serine/threonine-protein kinase [Kofleriaceae bacterium]